MCSPSQAELSKLDQRASRTIAIKPEVKGVKQLDNGINDTFLSSVRGDVSFASNPSLVSPSKGSAVTIPDVTPTCPATALIRLSKPQWPRTGLMARVLPLMFAVFHLMRRQLISTWGKEEKSRAESSYLSSAPRSQLASVAAAEYVLWQNSSNEAVGDSAFRTSSYIRRNSPSCPS